MTCLVLAGYYGFLEVGSPKYLELSAGAAAVHEHTAALAALAEAEASARTAALEAFSQQLQQRARGRTAQRVQIDTVAAAQAATAAHTQGCHQAAVLLEDDSDQEDHGDCEGTQPYDVDHAALAAFVETAATTSASARARSTMTIQTALKAAAQTKVVAQARARVQAAEAALLTVSCWPWEGECIRREEGQNKCNWDRGFCKAGCAVSKMASDFVRRERHHVADLFT